MKTYTIEELMPFCYVGEYRPSITRPWTRDGKTNATDGKIMVRIPASAEFSPNEDAPNVEKVWKDFNPDATFAPMPELPAADLQTCTNCGGNGISEGCTCENCEGGTVDMQQPIIVGTRQLDARFLRKIAALSFKFDGGEGLLMPMRQD